MCILNLYGGKTETLHLMSRVWVTILVGVAGDPIAFPQTCSETTEKCQICSPRDFWKEGSHVDGCGDLKFT